jgi:hypothetical protein
MMITLCLLVLCATATLGKTVRRGHPTGWVERQDKNVESTKMVSFRLALPQKNLDVLEREVFNALIRYICLNTFRDGYSK